MPANLSQPQKTPPAVRTQGGIGCVYGSEEGLTAAVAELKSRGVDSDAIRIGATDPVRAQAVAQRCGVRADVTADDPLKDLVGADQGRTRAAIDRAGILGASIGALTGLAAGFTSLGAVTPVAKSLQPLADGLLFSVLGAIAGSVLGAAFAPQPSTHAGFRLIDGMQEGAFALIVQAPRSRLDEMQKILEAAGGSGMTRV